MRSRRFRNAHDPSQTTATAAKPTPPTSPPPAGNSGKNIFPPHPPNDDDDSLSGLNGKRFAIRKPRPIRSQRARHDIDWAASPPPAYVYIRVSRTSARRRGSVLPDLSVHPGGRRRWWHFLPFHFLRAHGRISRERNSPAEKKTKPKKKKNRLYRRDRLRNATRAK